MKVSSRGGGLLGCVVWGPRTAPRAAAACGRRRPSRAACGPSALGRWAVLRPPRRLGPGLARLPERPRGGHRGAAARPGLSGLNARKVSLLQVSINEGSNEPSPPFPIRKVRGGGSENQAFLRNPDPSTLPPPSWIFNVLPGQGLSYLLIFIKLLGGGWWFSPPLGVCGCIKPFCQPLNSRKWTVVVMIGPFIHIFKN